MTDQPFPINLNTAARTLMGTLVASCTQQPVYSGVAHVALAQMGPVGEAGGKILGQVAVTGSIIMETPLGGEAGVWDFLECDVILVPRRIKRAIADSDSSPDKVVFDIAAVRPETLEPFPAG